MATTDIEGFLRNDPNCVHTLLTVWFDREKAAHRRGPWVIAISGRENGSASWRKLGTNITSNQAEPAAAGSLLEEIRKKIHDAFGNDPVCQVRVIAYHDGESQPPAIDRTATLGPPSLAEQTTIGMFQLMLDRLDRQNIALHNHLLTMSVQQSAVIGHLTSSNATLATARTAGTAASDLGSVGGTLGMLLMLGFWPKIKKYLGAEGGTEQLLEAVRESVADLLGDTNEDRPAKATPKPTPQLTGNAGLSVLGFGYPPAQFVPAGGRQAAPAPAQASQTPAADERVDVAGVLARLKQTGQIDEVARAVIADPELKAAATAAFFNS